MDGTVDGTGGLITVVFIFVLACFVIYVLRKCYWNGRNTEEPNPTNSPEAPNISGPLTDFPTFRDIQSEISNDAESEHSLRFTSDCIVCHAKFQTRYHLACTPCNNYIAALEANEHQ